MVNFNGDPHTGLRPQDIASRDLRVLVRGEPTAAQWLNIARAHEMAGMPENDIRLLVEVHRRTRG